MIEQLIISEKQFGSHAIVKSLNYYLRVHWSVHKKLKQTYALFIRNLMSLNNINRAIPNDSFNLNIVSYRRRLLDHDNLYGSHKWFIDALCDEGFIWDDDPKHANITIKQLAIKKHTPNDTLKTVVCRDTFIAP